MKLKLDPDVTQYLSEDVGDKGSMSDVVAPEGETAGNDSSMCDSGQKRESARKQAGYVDLNRVRGMHFSHCRRIGEFLDGENSAWSGEDGKQLLVPEKDLAKWKG